MSDALCDWGFVPSRDTIGAAGGVLSMAIHLPITMHPVETPDSGGNHSGNQRLATARIGNFGW